MISKYWVLVLGVGFFVTSDLAAATSDNRRKRVDAEYNEMLTHTSMLGPAPASMPKVNACRRLIAGLSARQPDFDQALPEIGQILSLHRPARDLPRYELPLVLYWLRYAVVEGHTSTLITYIQNENTFSKDDGSILTTLLHVVQGKPVLKDLPPDAKVPWNLRITLGALIIEKARALLPAEEALWFFEKAGDALIRIASNSRLGSTKRTLALKAYLAQYWQTFSNLKDLEKSAKLQNTLLESIDHHRLELEAILYSGRRLPDDFNAHLRDLILFLKLQKDQMEGVTVLTYKNQFTHRTGIFFSREAPQSLRRAAAIELEELFQKHFINYSEFLYRLKKKAANFGAAVVEEGGQDFLLHEDLEKLEGDFDRAFGEFWRAVHLLKEGSTLEPSIPPMKFFSDDNIGQILWSLLRLATVPEFSSRAMEDLLEILRAHPDATQHLSQNFYHHWRYFDEAIQKTTDQIDRQLLEDAKSGLVFLFPQLAAQKLIQDEIGDPKSLPTESRNFMQWLIDNDKRPEDDASVHFLMFSDEDVQSLKYALKKYRASLEYDISDDRVAVKDLSPDNYVRIDTGDEDVYIPGLPFKVIDDLFDLADHDDPEVSYQSRRYATLVFYYFEALWRFSEDRLSKEKWHVFEGYFKQAEENPEIIEDELDFDI